MKKVIYGLLCLSLAAVSCKKDNESTGIQPVNLAVKLTYGLDSSKYTLPLAGVVVSIKNTFTGSTQTVTAADSGIVHFNGIPAGTYDIDARISMSGAQYTALTGMVVTDSVTFNASEKNKAIPVGNEVVQQLVLVAGTTGDWVIKQVYYAGSDTKNGAIFRDQFIEIYNNSDHYLLADSLYIAQLWGRQNTTETKSYIQANGQYDWTKAQDMPAGIDANGGYVYARNLLRIPALKDTVWPGESIVIAQTALNHKAPYTGNDGKTITVINPDLTVDLSGADYEAYYAPFLASPYASDVDNPQVPNVEVIQYDGKDFVIDNLGRDSYAIFKINDGQNPANWPRYFSPLIAGPASSDKEYLQVPVKYMIDAVEVMHTSASSRAPKKLGASLDAGFTFVPKGSYSSQSVIRKTARTVNGIRKLKDTNNSTEDFDYFDVANPRGFK